MKGKEEPQEAYELLRPGEVETRIEASVTRGLTRFVGRAKEMETLTEAFRKAASGAGQVMVGEAGIGKSRVLLELRSLLPAGGYTYLEGRCLHYGSAMPYLPILDLLRVYFAIDEGAREFVVRKDMKEKLLALGENLSHILAPLQDLLSLKAEDEPYLLLDPPAKRERTLEVLRDLFVRISQDSPLHPLILDTSEVFGNFLFGL